MRNAREYWNSGQLPRGVWEILEGWCSENVVDGIEQFIRDNAYLDFVIDNKDVRILLRGENFEDVSGRLEVSVRERLMNPSEYVAGSWIIHGKYEMNNIMDEIDEDPDSAKEKLNEYYATLRDLFAEWSKEAGSRIKT